MGNATQFSVEKQVVGQINASVSICQESNGKVSFVLSDQNGENSSFHPSMDALSAAIVEKISGIAPSVKSNRGRKPKNKAATFVAKPRKPKKDPNAPAKRRGRPPKVKTAASAD